MTGMDITVVPAQHAMTRDENRAVIRRAWEAVAAAVDRKLGATEFDRLRGALNADPMTGWTADSTIAQYAEKHQGGAWGAKHLTRLYQRLGSRNDGLVRDHALSIALDAAMRAETSGLNIQAMAVANKIAEAQAAIAQALLTLDAMQQNRVSTDRPDALTVFACNFGTCWAMARLSLSGNNKSDWFIAVIRAIAESVEGKGKVSEGRINDAVSEARAWFAAMEKPLST